MRIAILGGSFNPAGMHHFMIIEEVLQLNFFDRVVIFPCGPRPDKKGTDDIEPVYRAAMVGIAFRDLRDKLEIQLDDLEREVFTRTIDIERRYAAQGEVWHIVGYDLVAGGRGGAAAIQREWAEGERLWTQSRFVVVRRKHFDFDAADLPPQSILIDKEIDGASKLIRNRCFTHQSLDRYVAPEVADYIERYGLYRGRLPAGQTLYPVTSPRLLIVADQENPKARAMEKALQPFSCPEHPNLIVDIGGDGNKLRAIKEYWHLRLPFFGLNAGHRGYLLNDVAAVDLFPLKEGLVVHHLPLLDIDLRLIDGTARRVLGFNEAWVERESGQSAWLEIIWNHENRIPKMAGDGLIVSTAAGSTGYAQNISGFSLPAYVRELLLVGMAVSEPAGWRHAIFSPNSVFEIRVLDSVKRPVRAFVDGIAQGIVEKMVVKTSKIASAELAFLKGYDITAKHTSIQLPYFQSLQ